MEVCGDSEQGRPLKPKLPAKRIRKGLSEKAKIAKRESDRLRAKNRVNLGRAHGAWKQIQEEHGFKTDADVALFLINVYFQSKSQAQLDSRILNGQSSSQTCESAHFEYQLSMSSQSEDEQEDSTAPSEESVTNRTDSEKKDSTSQDMKTEDDDSSTSQTENKAVEGKRGEEYNTSLIVGDGLHFVDLASSSEFIVDEECILRLFKSCRNCNRQCRVTKRVKGLKLVVSQACCYCDNRARWTNLPEDSSGFPINGKQTIHGQISSVM